jgi:ribosomal protein S18 acetylase RimI-like enzyme
MTSTTPVALHIGPAAADDARGVAQIHVRAWQSAYAGILSDDHLAALSIDKREAMWREAIEKQTPELLVARADAGMLGWISFGPSRDEAAPAGTGEVWALYVAPQHWGSGTGRQLWLRARERLVQRGFVSVSLWVLAANARAIRFYEVAGFAPEAGTAKDFELGGRRVQELRYTATL